MIRLHFFKQRGYIMRNLVILGGGYGGVKTLVNMLDKDLPDDLQITVIDKNPYHSLKTEFYTIAAGTVAEIDVRMEFPDDNRVNYVYAEVNQIDTENRKISFKKSTKIVSYDYLVIALGCEDNYHGVDGATEFTESVQTFRSEERRVGKECSLWMEPCHDEE